MKIYRFFIILFIIISLMISCDLIPVSIQDRLSRFETEINKNPREIYLHFHQGMVGYDGYKTELGFNGSPLQLGNQPFDITMAGNPVDYKPGIKSWDGTIDSGVYVGRIIKFYFQEDGVDWYILAIRMEWPVAQIYEWGDYLGT